MEAMAHRYVVVVPPGAPETLAYLTESFKNIPDVEVVLDRRRSPATSGPPLVERRASDRPHWTRDAFGCTLVRVATPPPAPVRQAPVTVLEYGGPATGGPPSPLEADAPAPTPGVPTHFGPIRFCTLPALRDG
jgi:hypothetical protein